MFKELRKLATTKLASKIICWLVRSYCATFRLNIVNEEAWLNYLEQGGRVLMCAWHQQLFSAFYYGKKFGKYNPSMMASKSLDGEITAGVAREIGWYPVRGSSSRDGGPALREMTNRLKKKCGLAILFPDGPRGPAGVSKPGAISLAHAADAVILPGYVQAENAWYLNSWDKFMIPKPFSRVTIGFCEMIKLPPIKSEVDSENQRKMLDDILQPYLIR
jgi:lysophospholipid acyltransferase (LPLAT)-like uncharacterized protein